MFLRELYHNVGGPGALGGVTKLYRAAKLMNPQITRKEVKAFLMTQKTYTLHKPIRKPKVYRRIIVKGLGELYQADLVDLQKYARVNNNYRYICFIICCFSKRLWTFKLKSKSGLAMRKALAQFFILNRVKLLQSDQGSEFFNKDFKRMMDAFGIKLYHTNTDKKAAIAERVQRTIREMLERHFTKTKKHRWVDVIDALVDNYNNTIHRTTNLKPAEVSAKHTPQILKALYPSRNDKSIKFRIGDEVRVARPRKTFEKRSEKIWLPDTYTVTRILNTNPKTYKLELDGITKRKSYYSAELQQVL